MVRVTVELVSSRGREHDRVLGVAQIANIGGDETIGNYEVRLSKWAPKQTETWKTAKFGGFNRKTGGAWDLLFAALMCTVGERWIKESRRTGTWAGQEPDAKRGG